VITKNGSKKIKPDGSDYIIQRWFKTIQRLILGMQLPSEASHSYNLQEEFFIQGKPIKRTIQTYPMRKHSAY
jgi:hypothetical protein